ncbi:receptor-like protein kinase FERONIA [Salvia miltiorrhiza]|uniref:receptor-like protein kinase FERONIA n=1 Tax=Salvia miltiorrhiza TaxID=226208 RepID=UPI0025AD5039|nr:receptor-like protein kinase FERONIA [Salvia miltiorrhiza]
MTLHLLIIICFFLFSLIAADPNHISINCGGAAPATALGGRQWLGDAAPEGSSRASTAKPELIAAVDPVPYKSARLSRSQFSYSFDLSPGQKIIRLHFNPVAYHGFERFNDFFTVEAGPYTLVANFSASITARALAVNTLAKEFCIIIQQRQHLRILFSPETRQSKYSYAFINGIEIISVPSAISYCHGGDRGIHVLGHRYVVHLDNSTALEIVHRQNIKWGSDDGMFGMWASSSSLSYNRMWRVGVDVGFRYLVRLHLCELGLKMHKDFMILIDEMIALTSPDDLVDGMGNNYNYMVMVEGQKREGKRNISISLYSHHEFLDKHGPFEGFEVFKLSNHDRSLASPNPPLLPRASDSSISRTTVVVTLLCLATVGYHLLQRIRDTEEDGEPWGRAKRLCHCFRLAEIKAATGDFHEGFVVGRGGFGKVYKGFMDNGRKIVAIKRLKPDSKQGEREFKMEVETLSELRHVNLVSLIGCCIEQKEMILVYEYMPNGTLADHLHKHNHFHPLSWKQRLNICIGAGRALDYLHTGREITHRDVKTSNILLDERLVAKVSDFGLAKSGTGSEESQSTQVKGTRGYLDPYYRDTRRVTQKSDTYSLGVVLLEVLSERAATGPWGEAGSLTRWAKEKIDRGQVAEIVAPSLRGKISADSLDTFVGVAARCVDDEPKERPAMTQIITQLQQALVQQEEAERNGVYSSSSTRKISVGLELSAGNVQREDIMMNSPRKHRPIWKTIWKIRKPSSYKMHLVGISAPSTLHCLERDGIRI